MKKPKGLKGYHNMNHSSYYRRLRRERERYIKIIMAENFQNLKKEMDNQIQEAQTRLKEMNPKKSTRYLTIKLSKVKDKMRILKSRKSHSSHKREPQ